MAKELKRLNLGIKQIAHKKMTRIPLSFIKPAPYPFVGFKEQEKNEDNMKAEVGALHNAMVDRLKADKKRKEAAVAGDDYFTVAFESGEQATAFLRGIGYPQFNDMIIDGLILAELLGIELPKAANQIKPLKTKHADSLTRLVTNPKWKDPSK